jgi:hypothetical protein
LDLPRKDPESGALFAKTNELWDTRGSRIVPQLGNETEHAMTTTEEKMPVSVEDLDINAERKSVQLSASKFQELVEYVDHVERALNLCELDLGRERKFVTILLDALSKGCALLNEIANYYGERERNRYYDLHAQWKNEVRRQAEEGNISDQHYKQMIQALGNPADHQNDQAEGGVGV